MHDKVRVITHHRIGVNAAGKNVAQLQNAPLHPRLAVLKAFAEIVIKAAKPSAPNTARNAVVAGSVRGVD